MTLSPLEFISNTSPCSLTLLLIKALVITGVLDFGQLRSILFAALTYKHLFWGGLKYILIKRCYSC